MTLFEQAPVQIRTGIQEDNAVRTLPVNPY